MTSRPGQEPWLVDHVCSPGERINNCHGGKISGGVGAPTRERPAMTTLERTWAYCEECRQWFSCPTWFDGAELQPLCPLCLAEPVTVQAVPLGGHPRLR